MSILSWIVFGLIAGAIARFIMPGKGPSGCVITCILGIVGAVVGGWLGTQFGFGNAADFSLRSLGVAVIGALVVLFVYGLVSGKRRW
jgi:uncharacterized membrane protein YeaQ/YmgE (transglycosylase-associated protein family)